MSISYIVEPIKTGGAVGDALGNCLKGIKDIATPAIVGQIQSDDVMMAPWVAELIIGDTNPRTVSWGYSCASIKNLLLRVQSVARVYALRDVHQDSHDVCIGWIDLK